MNLLTGLLTTAGVIYHDDWDLSEKGKRDAERHQEKIDEAIRKNARDVIGEENIITKKGKKKVRIPVRGMKDYRFIHGDNDGNVGGVGQGDGSQQPGDVIGRREKQGEGEGDQAGSDGEGHNEMEAEVEIDYLLKIMFEDLGLPWIEEKTKAKQLVPKGWKFETISKKGIMPRVHKKKTMIEAIKRNVVLAAEIMNETGCDEEVAYKALNQCFCDINDAIKMVQEGKVDMDSPDTIMIDNEDLRFKQIEEDVEYHSNAVVIAMMDVSGSMTREKKYLCRSLLFWMTEFLKKKYDFVEIKFIQHTTTAKIVDEETFFHKGESGGTQCYTAFEKANYMIDTEFPLDKWNVYCVYVGDGEDFDPPRTVTFIKEMLNKKINMLGYVEIDLDYGDDSPLAALGGVPSLSQFRTLLTEIKRHWNFDHKRELDTDFYKNEKNRFLCSVIRKKEHVWPTLKHMLFEKEK